MAEIIKTHIDSSESKVTPGGSTRWWKAEAGELADSMVTVAQGIENSPAQKARERDWLTHARLYANSPVASLYHMGSRTRATVARRTDEAPGNRINYNVVQSCIDTAAAKVSKNKTRALFLTTGGNHAQQERAKGLTKYCDGWAEQVRIYEKGQRTFVDGCIFDTGALKPFPDIGAGKVCLDRVLPHEILVDETEAIYGEPRSMYQRKYAPRDLVAEAFASKKTEEGRRLRDLIMRAAGSDPLRANGAAGGETDMLRLYEGWRLRSHPGKEHDGLHVIAVEGVHVPIFREAWGHDWHPFASFRWNTRAIGWWGQSLAEQLVGIQVEIGRLLRTIQRCMHLVSVPKYLVEQGSEVVDAHLNNEIGAIIKYKGTKPELWVAAGVPAELFAQLDRLVAKAYELSGISQLSANAKKPEGLDAAVALREFHDIESERFVVVAQRFEQMYLDAFRMAVAMSREMYEKRPDLRMLAPGTKLLEEIAWKDVDLDEDRYVMRAYPTSILPTTPAAKLQTVQELYGSKLLEDQSPGGIWARSLLDFPDLESFQSLEQAALENVQRLVGNIVDKGKYEPPDEFLPPDLVISIAHNAYLKGLNDGLPEDRLEMLRRLVQEADDNRQAMESSPAAQAEAVQAVGQQAPAAAPMPGPMMPGAAPGIPAVPSDLPALPAAPMTVA